MNGPALRMPFLPRRETSSVRARSVHAPCSVTRFLRPLILHVEAVIADAIAPPLVVDLLVRRDREAVEEEIVLDPGRRPNSVSVLAEIAGPYPTLKLCEPVT